MPYVVNAVGIAEFERYKRDKDSLNHQNVKLERPERYRIRYSKGVMRLEAYTPKPKASKTTT